MSAGVPTRQHSTRTVLRARELRQAGWSYDRIAALLTAESGRTVARTTVWRWLCEPAAERHHLRERLRQAEQGAEAATFRLQGTTAAYRVAFVRRLSAEGLSSSAIGVVCGVVFGERLTEYQVRYALRVGRLPSMERRAG